MKKGLKIIFAIILGYVLAIANKELCLFFYDWKINENMFIYSFVVFSISIAFVFIMRGKKK